MRNTKMVLAQYASAAFKAALIAATMLASMFVASQPAHADDRVTPMYIPCDNKGQKWFSWSSTSKPAALTHKRRIENYGATNYTADETVWHESTLTASFTWSGEATVSGDAVIASLEIKTGQQLQTIGAKTWGYSYTTRVNTPPYTVEIYFAGTFLGKGNYNYYYCNYSGQLRKSYGSAQSWTVQTKGKVSCANYPPSNTVAYLAKQQGC